MIRDIIERFRYRFELWRRERREDLFGTPRTDPLDASDDASRYADPKYAVILSESTARFLGRIVFTYFGVVFLAAQICWLVAGLFPFVRLAVGISFLVFTGVWTLASIFSTLGFCKARKAHREEATKSSNRTMEPTATRSVFTL